MFYEIYPWQEDCLNAWSDTGTVGCVSAVTGSGKTILAMHAICRLKQSLSHPLRVRIVVPTIAIMHQWLRTLRSFRSLSCPDGFAEAEIGCRYGGYRCRDNCRYIVYVINSARDVLAHQIRRELELGSDVLLIADECHHCYSRENRRIFRFLPLPNALRLHYHALGLSATPDLPINDRTTSEALGNIFYQYGFEKALSEERISSFVIIQIGMHFNEAEQLEYNRYSQAILLLMRKLQIQHPFLKNISSREAFPAIQKLANDPALPDETAMAYLQAVYKRKELVCLAESRTNCLQSLLSCLDTSDRILIFCERIRQANNAYNTLLPLFGSQLGKYHSGLSPEQNRQALRAYRDGETRILISCKALDEGVDVPDANVGIVLSGTGIPRQRIQRLGRILRRSDHKHMAVMYYFYIKESAEDEAYLPDQKLAAERVSIEYDASDGGFTGDRYEETAIAVLEEMKNETSDDAKLLEARRCIMEGLPRADWLASEEYCSRRADAASNIHHRNYWLCMGRMQRQHQKDLLASSEGNSFLH